MLIDVILVFLLLIATYKGYQRGLIVGVFSFVAIVVGIAAAMKLSVVAASYLQHYFKWEGAWLPAVSYFLVFIGVVLLIRLVANAMEEGVKVVKLGWMNTLGGIIFYWLIFLLAYSVVVFYAVELGLFSESTTAVSESYAYISPLGPKIIEGFATIFPLFSDMFRELENFFAGLSEKIPPR
jgi:membrane protein required for colicin V production